MNKIVDVLTIKAQPWIDTSLAKFVYGMDFWIKL